MGSQGWPFAQVDSFPGVDEDPLYHSEHVKDLYIKADPNYGGRSVLNLKISLDLEINPHAAGSLSLYYGIRSCTPS